MSFVGTALSRAAVRHIAADTKALTSGVSSIPSYASTIHVPGARAHFTYGTTAQTTQPTHRFPIHSRVRKAWHDPKFRDVATATPTKTSLVPLRELRESFADAEKRDKESGVVPKDTTVTYGDDTEIDYTTGYAENKVTHEDIERGLMEAVPGYRPLTASERASLYADGPFEAKVIHAMSRHVEGEDDDRSELMAGYHNLNNKEFSKWKNWLTSNVQQVSMLDPFASQFGLKQADQHGRMMDSALDQLLPTVTDSQIADERKGINKMLLCVTGLNGRHLETSDMNREALREQARLKMLKHGASPDEEAQAIPTIAFSGLNETMHDDGFCKPLSLEQAESTYLDGRAILQAAKAGIVPHRVENTEEEAESRIKDLERTLGIMSWKLAEWLKFNGKDPTVILGLDSSCQVLAKKDREKHGQGGKDGRGLIKGNQQTTFDIMKAIMTDKSITLRSTDNLYDHLTFQPQVNPSEVIASCGPDKTPGVPGTDISDIAYEASPRGKVYTPKHRRRHRYQKEIDERTQLIQTKWSTWDDKAKTKFARNFGLSASDIESDPETMHRFTAKLQVESAVREQRAKRKGKSSKSSGSSKESSGSSKISLKPDETIDTGIASTEV